jgi:hypothetical protein
MDKNCKDHLFFCSEISKKQFGLNSVTYSRVVRFEVFTAVTMKNAVFWYVVPYRSCVDRRFGGTYRLHFQGRKIRKRGTSLSRWLQTVVCSFYKYNK